LASEAVEDEDELENFPPFTTRKRTKVQKP
jgi:hypothetical protein